MHRDNFPVTAEEQRDQYIGERTAHHVQAIRAALATGDKQLLAQMDEAIGARLFDSAQWAALIQSTAQGKDAFAQLLGQVIAAEAEIRAIKDVEQDEHAAEQEAAEDRADQIRWDRVYLAGFTN